MESISVKNFKSLLFILLVSGFSLIAIYSIVLKDYYSIPTSHSKTNILSYSIYENELPINRAHPDDKKYYKVLFISWDTQELTKANISAILKDYKTLSISLQYYYTTLHNSYDYTYYTFNQPANDTPNSIDCTTWRFKNGTYKFGLAPNYCKILLLYDILSKYSQKYDFIVYLDSDSYVTRMKMSFKKWVLRHFNATNHNKTINDYAMIFVSQKPRRPDQLCSGIIVVPTYQSEIAKTMLQYWYSMIGIFKNDSIDAHTHPRDQGVLNKYVKLKFKNMIYEIDERQLYSCQAPRRFYAEKPYFVHFTTRKRNQCNVYERYHKSLRTVGIYNNVSQYVYIIDKYFLRVPNFSAIQEIIYTD